MTAMTPVNPLFYTGSYAPDLEALTMQGLLQGVQSACYGPTFDGPACAAFSQTLGRVRALDSCGCGAGGAAGVGPIPKPLLPGGNPNASVQSMTLAATNPPPANRVGNTPATLAAALAAIGSTTPATTLARCG